MEIEGAPADDVAPVGCDDREENMESEKVEPDVVLDVGCGMSGAENDEFWLPPAFEESNENDDATLAMIDPFAPLEFGFALGLEVPPVCDPKLELKLEPKLGNAPVCMGCCCCCSAGLALF